MTYRILVGDVLEQLATLPAESVHCVVTSPPYWGLRDYGVAGQIGLEPTPGEFLAKMVAVFREVRRVLRVDGTCWVNMGDSYSNETVGPRSGGTLAAWKNGGRREPNVREPATLRRSGLPAKNLVGIPWRLAFALQDDGWWLRQDIIWAKPNPMPESVTDRCTKAHEYVFLLTKSAQYYFDAQAIKERASLDSHARTRKERAQVDHKSMPDDMRNGIRPPGVNPKAMPRPVGWASGPGSHKAVDHNLAKVHPKTRPKQNASFAAAVVNLVEFRNKRSVWEIPSQSYPEAHFATYPEALVKPCILAGSPAGGVVLDPFSGSGTTGVVALRHGRSYIGSELNPEYVELSHRRIQGDRPLFNREEEAACYS